MSVLAIGMIYILILVTNEWLDEFKNSIDKD